MALHGPLPVAGAVHIQNGLAPDGCWIQDKISPRDGQAARRLREPLVPADAHAHPAILGIKHFETGIAGREIKLFLVIVVIRDMGLAVDAQQAAVGVQHGHTVEQALAVLFIKADRHSQFQLPAYLGKTLHSGIFVHRQRIVVVLVPAFLAEVRTFKQLGQQNDLRPFGGGLTDQFFGVGQILGRVGGAGHLDRRDRDLCHRRSLLLR